MGVSLILHTFYWLDIEPEQGRWNFQGYDTLVNNANERDLKVVGILAYDNWWIHADQKTHKYIPPDRIPDFLEYVRKTVDHFRGRVYAWCIWNEPNFHFWPGTR
jgi:GH35 family endo-1,4-beta-xylanase